MAGLFDDLPDAGSATGGGGLFDDLPDAPKPAKPQKSWRDEAFEASGQSLTEDTPEESLMKSGGGKFDPVALAQNILEIGKGIPSGAMRAGASALEGMAAFGAAAQDRSRISGEVPGLPYTEEELGKPTKVTDQPGYKSAQAIKGAADKVLPAAPGYEDSVGRQLGEGLGSVVTGVAASAVGGPITSGGMFLFMGAGEAVDRAIAEGATEDQIITAAGGGLIPGLTDALPIETLMGRIPVPGAKVAARLLPTGKIGDAIRAAGKIGWQAVIEGVQEGGQQFLQNVVAQQVYKPDQELGEGIIPNAGVGAGVGALSEVGKMLLEAAAGRRGGRSINVAPTGQALQAAQQAAQQAAAPQAHPGPGAGPAPVGVREAAVQQPIHIEQGDIDSPIDTDLIAGGRAKTADALATTEANAILTRNGWPVVGQQVSVDMGGNPVAGVIEDAFTTQVPGTELAADGVKVRLADGRLLETFKSEGAKITAITTDEKTGEITSTGPGTAEGGIEAFAQANPEAMIGGGAAANPLVGGGDLAAPALAIDSENTSISAENGLGEGGVEAPQTMPLEPAAPLTGDGTRKSPVDVSHPDHLDAAVAVVNTAPTDAQKEAGNYQKAHIKVQGLDIAIENPAGSERSGVDPNGEKWTVSMPANYGYIKRTVGADEEQIDVYVGPNPQSQQVFVIDQQDADSKAFDEHKVMMGFDGRLAAEKAYLAAFSDGRGRDRIGAVHPMTMEEFKTSLAAGKWDKPLGPRADVEAEEDADFEDDFDDEAPNPADDKIRADIIAEMQAEQNERYPAPPNWRTDLAAAREYGAAVGIPDAKKLKNLKDLVRSIEGNLSATYGNKYLIAQRVISRKYGLDGKPPREGAENEKALQDYLAKAEAAYEKAKADGDRGALDNLNRTVRDVEYDLYRIEAQRVSERWETVFEAVLPSPGKNARTDRGAAGRIFIRRDPVTKRYTTEYDYNAPQSGGNGGGLVNKFATFEEAAADAREFFTRKGTGYVSDSPAERKELNRLSEWGKNLKIEESNPPPSDDSAAPAAAAPADEAPADVTESDDENTGNDDAQPAETAAPEPEGEAVPPAPAAKAPRKRFAKMGDVGEAMAGKRAQATAAVARAKDLDALLAQANDSRDFGSLLAEDATSGAHKYAFDIRNAFQSFMEWQGGQFGAGRRKWQDNFSDRLKERWEGEDADAAMLAARRDEIRTNAADYITLMETLGAAIEGAQNVEEVQAGLKAALLNTEAGDKYNKLFMALNKYRRRGRDLDWNLSLDYSFRYRKDTDALPTKATPLRRFTQKLDDIERTGLPDRRKGQDVSAEDFRTTFGFRGVEFGDWVSGKERQQHVNLAYDSLFDFADTLGIPPKAISLGGTLGLAFGSRGRGRHAAHYEPDNKVINLTRTSGDGSVAHEWGHALDYALRKDQRAKTAILDRVNNALSYSWSIPGALRTLDNLLTGRSRISTAKKRDTAIDQARDYVARLYRFEGWSAKVATQFQRNGNDMDPKYWGSTVELFARSFESWVFDKMAEKNGASPYLVNDWVAEGKVSKDAGYRGTPYPTEEDRVNFADMWKQVFDKLEWSADGAPSVKFGGKHGDAEIEPVKVGASMGDVKDALDAIDLEERRQQLILEGEARNRPAAPPPAAAPAAPAAAEPAPTTYGADNKLVSRDRADELRARLRQKLKSQLSSGIDPEIMAIGAELAAFHIEAGTRRFADFAQAIATDLGTTIDKIRPYLRSWYNGARDMMEDAGQDVTGMDSADEVKAAVATLGAESAQQGTSEPVVAAAPSKDKIAQAVREHLGAGKAFATIRAARGLAAEVLGDNTAITSGTPEAKAAEESIERGILLAAKDIIAAGGDRKAIFGKLVDLYARQPNLSTRSSTSVEQQAYSTPVPLAYLAGVRAGITKDTTVYEPTAGNGALLLTADPAKVTANELNPDREDGLHDFLPGAKITNRDAAAWTPGDKIMDVVIANPPFGVVKDGAGESTTYRVDDRYSTNEVDHAIALKALGAMKDDGSAVLIVGGINKMLNTREARSDAYNGKAKRQFYLTLYGAYKVVDHFTVDGGLYAKQGAGWPVDVIVIQGRGKSDLRVPAADVPRIYKSWDELKESLGGRSDQSGGDVRQADAGGVGTGTGSASGDARTGGSSGQRGTGAGPLVSASEDGNASGVREPAADGQPARGGMDERPAGVVSPAADADGPSGADRRLGELNPDQPTQVPYKASSAAPGLGTLVPYNMQTSLQDALDRLRDRVGDLDAFVADRLGYKKEELATYFGAEQVDAIAMAVSEMERGAGFILGDQTGVGKGRVVAGVIRYALKIGRVPTFVTEKPNLYGDMYRDLTDTGIQGLLGRDINILMTDAGKNVPLDEEGKVRLKTGTSANHDALLARAMTEPGLAGHDVVFTTYSQMQTLKGGETMRRNFLRHAAQGGIVVFDESHNAGGTAEERKPKKTKDDGTPQAESRAAFARTMAGLAHGVTYSSATYAKRPDVMDLYATTDMKLAVTDLSKLAEAISKGGVPMQQVVATMLAKAGQYVRRERSFEGITYNTPVIPVSRDTYNRYSSILSAVQRFSEDFVKPAAKSVGDDLKAEGEGIGYDNATGAAGASSTSFSAVVHNLIDQMLLAIKADAAADLAIEAIKRGEKPVITVANTMGAFIADYTEGNAVSNGDRIDIDFNKLLRRYLERTRTLTIKKPWSDEPATKHYLTDKELGFGGVNAYNAARELIEETDLSSLPVSPIDHMRYRLEKAGYKVGEITGRDQVINYGAKGGARLGTRGTAETSVAGKRATISAFNGGKMDAIILNQSGATGLSLHANTKFKDQRKRRMIIAQAEKNIDTHMQMLGRVNRTGQVVLPEYDQMVADLPAEKRPAAVLAKKMASLNANTTAARGSALTAKDVPDFMNIYGDQVAARVMSDMPELHARLDDPLEGDGDGLDTDDAMRRVTGRIPFLPIEEQEALYETLETEYAALLAQREAAGENTLEAKTLDLKAQTLDTRRVVAPVGTSSSPFGGAVDIETVEIRRPSKPFPAAQVIEAASAAVGIDTPAGDLSPALAKVLAAGVKQAQQQEQEAVEAFRAYKAEMVKAAAPEARTAMEEKLNAVALSWRRMRQKLPVGETVKLMSGDGNLYGVVVGVRRVGNAKNPLAPGQWKATVALADAARQLTIPFSQLYPAGAENAPDSAFVVDHAGSMMGAPIIEMFDKMQFESRERRQIVTGNLLAGYDHVGQKGSIINYTDATGDVRQGVLLPKDYNYAKFQAMRPVTFRTPDQVFSFVMQRGLEANTPQNTVVLARHGNGLHISVDAGKARGGKFYLDKAVLAELGRDFVTSGGRMRADASAGDARAVIEALMKAGAVFQTEQHKKEAAEIVGNISGAEGEAQFNRRGAVGPAETPNVPYAPANADTIRRGADAMVSRLQLQVGLDRSSERDSPISREQVREIEDFIAFIGDHMFQGAGLSISNRESGALGMFHLPSQIVTLYRRAVETGELTRTAVHEFWHYLDQSLSADERESTRREFERKRGIWLDANPWARGFIGFDGIMQNRLAGNEAWNWLQNNKVEGTPVTVSKTEGGADVVSFPWTNENYRFHSRDEYFAEAMTDKYFDYLNLQDEKARSIIGWARAIWDRMKAGLRRLFGIDETGRIFEGFARGQYAAPMRDGRTGSLMMAATQKPANLPPIDYEGFENPESEKRFSDARKPLGDAASFMEQAGALWGRVVAGMTRHFEYLPNTPVYSALAQKLRSLEAAPDASREAMLSYLRGMVKGLTPQEYDVFSRKVILDDLSWEVAQEHDLPFAMTPETVKSELAKVDAILAKRPDLMDRVRQRKLFVADIARQMVETGVLDKQQALNPYYYRHVVIEHAQAALLQARTGTTSERLRAPYWARRMGSSKDIVSNLLHAESDWLFKAMNNIAEARTIQWIKESDHNVRDRMMQAAHAYNKAEVDQRIQDDIAARGFRNGSGRLTSPMDEEYRSFGQKIAIGMEKVKAALARINPADIPADLQAVVANMSNDVRDDRVFNLLNWILENNMPGAEGAMTAFAGITGRRQWVEKLLGDDFADTNDVKGLIKKGFAGDGDFVAWQPDEGRFLFMAKTLPEHFIDRQLRGLAEMEESQIAELLGSTATVTPAKVIELVQAIQKASKEILAVGGQKYEMVLPKEVADTLNHLKDGLDDSLYRTVLESPVRAWKVWTLFNPRRYAKYFLNNLSGDIDAVIAGGPKVLGKLPAAVTELWNVIYKGAEPSQNYRDAVARGVLSTNLTAQEMGEIANMSEFAHLIDKATGAEVSVGRRFLLTPVGRAWNAGRQFQNFRENWMRYAAYLHAMENLTAGKEVSEFGYGGSNPAMIDTLTDDKDKAALWARDLLGDYGNISKYGRQLRRFAIPFWSWTEINTKRYYRFTSNAFKAGVGEGLATGGAMGAVLGVRVSAYLFIRMFAVYGLIQLWNNLLFGDDEDKLSLTERQQLHVLLGRGPDGEIISLRLQGALSDALGWFGFSDALQSMEQIEAGRADMSDLLMAVATAPVKKLVGGLTPVITTPFELASGKSLFPDPFNPRNIRDPWRELAQTFSFEHEYDQIAGKPSRGYGRSLVNALVYTRDPGEISYNNIRGLTYDWLEREKGQAGAGGFNTDRSNALYEWRTAKKYGDKAAEDAAMARLKELGVNGRSRRESLKRAHPLGALAMKDRAKFKATLSAREMAQLDEARAWYADTFLGDDDDAP